MEVATILVFPGNSELVSVAIIWLTVHQVYNSPIARISGTMLIHTVLQDI